jgi:iron(III) transport system substrate-binding protein
VVIPILAAVTAATGCGGGSSAGGSTAGGSHTSNSGGGGGGSLTIYNGQHKQETQALADGFEKKTGIHVKLRSGGQSELANQILAEGSKSPADVIFTEDSLVLTKLQEKGLLAKVDPSTLAKVPDDDSSTKDRWVGVSERIRVMAYNPAKIKKSDLPSSVLDLAKPKWKGKLGIEPTSGSLAAVVTAIRLTDGKDKAVQWLRGITRNAKRYNSHDAILKAVNSGRIPVGLMEHYYWYRQRDEIGKQNLKAKLYYFTPNDPGVLRDVSGAAVLKSAPHPKAAQRFLAYMVSKAGQKAINGSDSWEYTLNLPPRQALTPLAKIQPLEVPLIKLGHGLPETMQEERQAGLI